MPRLQPARPQDAPLPAALNEQLIVDEGHENPPRGEQLAAADLAIRRRAHAPAPVTRLAPYRMVNGLGPPPIRTVGKPQRSTQLREPPERLGMSLPVAARTLRRHVCLQHRHHTTASIWYLQIVCS
ncbi:hypothetical protein GCM10009608_64510 [Pseudonocardia alaniniphila]